MVRMEGNLFNGLRDMRRQISSPKQVLRDIGEEMLIITRQRFIEEKDPTGKRWAPNKWSTILNYLGGYKGKSFTKKGNLTKYGAKKLGVKKILFRKGYLKGTLRYQILGKDRLEVGSHLKYAPTMQKGAKKGTLGRTKRGTPIPWGDIPPRVWLGINSSDRLRIDRIINRYLGG